MLREAAWKRSFAVAQDMQRYVESERAGSVLDLSGEGLSLWTRELAEAVSTQNRAGTRVIRAQQDVCAFVRVRACVPACARVCVCACVRVRARARVWWGGGCVVEEGGVSRTSHAGPRLHCDQCGGDAGRVKDTHA